jgi:putative peptidoglycan lipid II flippase
VPFVLKEGFFPKLIFKNINQSVKKIFYISLPRTITVSSAEISELFLISFASFLTVGSISIFNLSFNLQSVPFSIIGVSYAIAIFPTLSKHFACKEFESFLEKIIKTSSHIIFWSIPATVFIFIFRVQIVSLLLGAGKFDTLAIYLTCEALALLFFDVGFLS